VPRAEGDRHDQWIAVTTIVIAHWATLPRWRPS